MNIKNYMSVPGDPERWRKILANRSELKKMFLFARDKGHSLVALNLKWSSNGYVKIEIGLARGKTKFDKRETIKAREAKREQKQNLGM